MNTKQKFLSLELNDQQQVVVMRCSAKKFAQLVAATSLFLFYGTLITVWGEFEPPVIADNEALQSASVQEVPSIEFQERAPRSIGTEQDLIGSNLVEVQNSFNQDSHLKSKDPFSKLTSVQKQRRGFNTNVHSSYGLESKKEQSYSLPTSSTSKLNALKLNDIFISVKTTKSFHQTRLDVILRTWFALAKEEVSKV